MGIRSDDSGHTDGCVVYAQQSAWKKVVVTRRAYSQNDSTVNLKLDNGILFFLSQAKSVLVIWIVNCSNISNSQYLGINYLHQKIRGYLLSPKEEMVYD